MAIPTPRLMVYRENESGVYKLQPCALEEETGAQPECGRAVRVSNPEEGDGLARAVLELLPRSMQPIGADRLVHQSVDERRRWVAEHTAVFVEAPDDDTIEVVPFRRQGRHYEGGRSIKVRRSDLKANLSALTAALVRALGQAEG